MRRHIPVLVAVSLFLLAGSVFALQDSSSARQEMAIKQAVSGYPKALRMSAKHITQEGTMIHLSGSAEIRIFTTEKENLVIRADEADYNGVTGEVTSRGSVRAVIEATR
ncbi:MAG TPA: hypothetical protein VK210_16680 [Terriglobia bacterium]|nr:hypothetical protein [Terriglobia bacterium]